MIFKDNSQIISRKIYILAIILLSVFGFNLYQIENNFILSFICLALGCIYTGIYFFATIKNDVESEKYFIIFLKGLVFYYALFTVITRIVSILGF